MPPPPPTPEKGNLFQLHGTCTCIVCMCTVIFYPCHSSLYCCLSPAPFPSTDSLPVSYLPLLSVSNDLDISASPQVSHYIQ